MARKGHIQKRDVLADPLYNNKVVTKLINNIMLDGKKGVAQKIVYGAFARVEEKTGKPALEVFEEAMNNIMPMPEVDFNRIAAMNLDRDLETALQNDYTLKINSRKAAKAGSEDVRKVYAQTSASDREQIGSTLTSAFRSVHEAKTAYDEAVLNLEVATKKLTTASNQYGLGSISLLEYRQADSEQVSAQTDLEVKRLALLQAIESYDWLVKGVR